MSLRNPQQSNLLHLRSFERRPSLVLARRKHSGGAMTSVASAESLNQLTSVIIQAAIRIHKVLGPGLLESTYLSCLGFELSTSGVAFEMQKAIPLVYRGVRIDCAYRADLID